MNIAAADNSGFSLVEESVSVADMTTSLAESKVGSFLVDNGLTLTSGSSADVAAAATSSDSASVRSVA